MDDGILPAEYVEKFSLSQFSVPPLSGPLVRKAFKNSTGFYPEDVFQSLIMKVVTQRALVKCIKHG
jgi:predicted unusual protein kinase regulating ubiquinone biosynthesis (AarF/ABC1/UbiB family)